MPLVPLILVDPGDHDDEQGEPLGEPVLGLKLARLLDLAVLREVHVHRQDPRPQLALEGARRRCLTSEDRAMHHVVGEAGLEPVEEVHCSLTGDRCRAPAKLQPIYF